MTDNLRAFLLKHRETTDVFCFQEVEERFAEMGRQLLGDFHCVYTAKGTKEDQNNYANSTYLRQGVEWGDVHTLFEEESECGIGLHIRVSHEGKNLSLVNFHGQWQPGTKEDTEVRLYQSREILAFLKDKDGPCIVGGDFNLLLDTESVLMFERAGYRNLIRDFAIPTTRNRISWDMWPDLPQQLWADFVFVSPDIQVKSFEVPQDDESSDHLPMILELDL